MGLTSYFFWAIWSAKRDITKKKGKMVGGRNQMGIFLPQLSKRGTG